MNGRTCQRVQRKASLLWNVWGAGHQADIALVGEADRCSKKRAFGVLGRWYVDYSNEMIAE